MNSNFDCIYKSLITEENINKRINTIKSMYGEQHGPTIEALLKVAEEFSKEIDNIPPVNKKNPIEDVYARKEEARQRKLDKMMEILDGVDYDIPDGTDDCQLEYVLGNAKVGKDTIIINMGPATLCDAANDGQCEFYKKGFCYAQNNETTYKEAFIRRFQEKLQWRTMDADVMASQLAQVIIQKKKIKYVRFNEAGDFKDKTDKQKLGNVVKATNKILTSKGYPEVIFYTYTHRSDLFKNGINDIGVPNLIIQGSGFYKKNKKGKATETNKPFFVDNCFMGIDYPNLVNLINNGDISEITETLGIDFEEAASKKIVICRGACQDCPFCKQKGPYIILVCYHGLGSIIKEVSTRMTNNIEKLYKDSALQALDLMNLPEDMKSELFNMTHFNENELVEKLISYGKYSNKTIGGKKVWISPRIDLDTIPVFVKHVRDTYGSKLRALEGEGGVRVSKPITKYLLGDKKKSGLTSDIAIQKSIDAAKKYNNKKEVELNAAGILPESYFDSSIEEILEEKKDNRINLNKFDILDFANYSLANRLSSIKGYIPPTTIQNLLEENGYDIDVITGEDTKEPEDQGFGFNDAIDDWEEQQGYDQ